MEKQKKLVFKSAFPKYAKDKYDSFFLLKFFDTEEHRDYFLSGKLYMRQLTEFALQELGRGRSDYAEGAGLIVMQYNKEKYVDFKTISENGNLYIEVTEYSEPPEGYLGNPIVIHYSAENQRKNIFSMYTLWYNREKSCVCPIDVDEMDQFGEYGIIIPDWSKFLGRVARAMDKDESILKAVCGFIEYYGEEQQQNIMLGDAFLKNKDEFSYQNEFRICADTDNMSLLELDTHLNFEDIAIPIRLSQFAETVRCKERQVQFIREKIKEK